jgi:hypothetical protein
MKVSGYAPATLTPVQNASTHWRGGWVGPRDGPDVSEERKSTSSTWIPDSPVRSEGANYDVTQR